MKFTRTKLVNFISVKAKIQLLIWQNNTTELNRVININSIYIVRKLFVPNGIPDQLESGVLAGKLYYAANLML